MGKKRQKVNWVTVDGLHWTGTEEADTTQSGEPSLQVKGGKERAGSRRTSGQGWSTSVVGPRFEKKVVPTPPPPPPPACLASADCGDSQPKHIYYDGELCEAETLPNGFTKIRSKNLDILFKREYYEQRLATQKQLSEDLKKAEAEKTPTETGSESCNDTEIISEKDPMDPMEPAEVVEHESQTLDKIDPDEIREFKPMNHGLEAQTPVAEAAHGGYSQLSSMEELPQEAFINQRPNLYLYSPSNNTLIPCEEIIIPNPVLSPESGEPLYTGPTNIYLAYPVQGPDGRSYITQPFPIHGDPAYNTAYNGYSPTVSYDGSNYYSSTPHTPSSGEDSGSGSSTQPTSPPPLVNYHPSNWFKEQQGGVGSDYSCLEYNYPTKPMASHHPPAPPASGVGAGVSAEKINLRDNSSRLNNNSSSSTSPCLPAGGVDQPSNSVTVTYIPGLPQEEITQSSKSQKKRKKKSKPKQEKSNGEAETQDTADTQDTNTKSSSLQFDLDIPAGKVEETHSEESSEPRSLEAAEEDKTENVFEIQLTDDLADSLVNPPTDTEVMEENITVKTPPPSEENGEGNEEELKINSEETSETINTSTAVKNVKNEVKVDLNSEDREICEITDQISTRKIENSTKFANTLDNEELNSNCKNLTESDDNLNKNVLSTNPEMSKKGARNEKKMKQKKQKRGLKVVPNSEDGQNKCSNIEAEADNNSDAASGTLKKSYSSVIKSNLQSAAPVAPAGPAAPAAPGSADKTDTNDLGSANIPLEKAGQSEPPRNKSKTKTKQAGRREEKAPIVRSDSWENIPASVVQQDELTWEKSSKKRKQRNKSQVQTAVQTRPDQSEAGQEEEATVMEIDKKVIESKQARQKTPDSEPIKESRKEERAHSESVAREDEGDSEKRKMKKKKKKHESEECEDASSVHRVLICDDQLLHQYTREIRKAKDVLCPNLVDKMSSAGYCDVLYVSELGSGIHRGAMGFGRLYQGKYVPPERTDIVGDIDEDGDDKTEDKDDKSDQDNDQTTEANEAELELSCNQSAGEADIDLD